MITDQIGLHSVLIKDYLTNYEVHIMKFFCDLVANLYFSYLSTSDSINDYCLYLEALVFT